MTISINRPMTLEEYLHYDDGTDAHYELVDGVLVEMGAENPQNITIAIFLISILLQSTPYYLIHRDTVEKIRTMLPKLNRLSQTLVR